MSVPVRGSIKFDTSGRWLEEISRRLIALEKAAGGAASSPPSFTSPATPPYGGGGAGPGGPTGPPGPAGPPGASGVTEHGDLTGLGNDDHPQYAKNLQAAPPARHVHGAEDLLLERRPEPVMPHVHAATDVQGLAGTDAQSARAAHTHLVPDVVDLRPDDAQFILAAKMWGG